MASPMSMTIFWLVVVFAGIAILSYIGSRRARTLKDYLISGGRVGPVLIALSWMAAWDSGGAMIGVPGVAYALGYSAVVLWGFAVLAVPISVMLVSTKLKKFSTVSSSLTFTDIAGSRYDSNTIRIVCAFMMLIFMFISIVAQLKGGGVCFQAVTGFPWQWCVVLIAAICVLVAAGGGMFTLIWSNAFLCVVMLIGAVTLTIGGTSLVGWFGGLDQKLLADPLGLKHGLQVGLQGNVLVSFFSSPKYFDTTPVFGELSIFGALGWFFAMFIGTLGLPHTSSIYLALKPMSKKSYTFFIFFITTLAVLLSSVMFYGLAARAHFGDKFMKNIDLAIPSFAVDIFSSPVAGFIITGFLMAVATTVGSALLVTVTSAVRTIYRMWVKEPTDRGEMTAGKIGAVLLGLIAMFVTISNPPAYLAKLHYLVYSSLGFAFVFAVIIPMYWRRANTQGALIAMVVATLVTITGLLVFKWPTGTTMFVSFLLTGATWYVGTMLFPPPSQELVKKCFPEAQVKPGPSGIPI